MPPPPWVKHDPATTRPLVAGDIPLIRQQAKASIEKNYLNGRVPKALALGPFGGCLLYTSRLVYVAPERLLKSDTIDFLKKAKVTLLAVDEAHCISQWGHDFRPEYAALGSVQAALGGVQTVAFTATADAATRTRCV